jgi:hypothetical protein
MTCALPLLKAAADLFRHTAARLYPRTFINVKSNRCARCASSSRPPRTMFHKEMILHFVSDPSIRGKSVEYVRLTPQPPAQDFPPRRKFGQMKARSPHNPRQEGERERARAQTPHTKHQAAQPSVHPTNGMWEANLWQKALQPRPAVLKHELVLIDSCPLDLVTC